jgi:hypothetical protein
MKLSRVVPALFSNPQNDPRGGKRGRPAADGPNQCVVGIVECGGRAVALTAENAAKQNLYRIAKDGFSPNPLFRDDWAGYNDLKEAGYSRLRRKGRCV